MSMVCTSLFLINPVPMVESHNLCRYALPLRCICKVGASTGQPEFLYNGIRLPHSSKAGKYSSVSWLQATSQDKAVVKLT